MKKEKSNEVDSMDRMFSRNIVPPKNVVMAMLAEKRKDLEASNLLMELTATALEKKYRKKKVVLAPNVDGNIGGVLTVRVKDSNHGWLIECDTLPDNNAVILATEDESMMVKLFYNRQRQITSDIYVLEKLAHIETSVPDAACYYQIFSQKIKPND